MEPRRDYKRDRVVWSKNVPAIRDICVKNVVTLGVTMKSRNWPKGKRVVGR